METGIPNPADFSSLPHPVMRRRLPSPQTRKHFSMNVLLSYRVRKYFLPVIVTFGIHPEVLDFEW
jgi:hypothetical protein